MLNNRSLFLLTVVTVFLFSCSNTYYYKKGLYNAQNPTPDKVYNQLAQVMPGNNKLVWDTINGKPYVLAVTWKSTKDTGYFTKKANYNSATGLYSYNTGTRPIFVTVAPYLKEQKLNRLNDKKLTMRLNQMLGLPPKSTYAYFIEVWVSPEDIIRPCFSSSITASACEYTPSNDDVLNTDHMSWLYKYIYDSYQDTDREKRYPFSHLGYTYDWSRKNKSHVGLSEFVIGRNKDIYVRKIYSTRAYFE